MLPRGSPPLPLLELCERAAQILHKLLCKNADAPAIITYEAIITTCADQLRQDAACPLESPPAFVIGRIFRARGLIGCRSVTFHPHCWWFSSPMAGDEALNSVRSWPADCAVLLLDAFSPEDRPAVLRRAAATQLTYGFCTWLRKATRASILG